ncbi:MAG: four-helix bundle copper-binding protein, partial [Actinomycetota bacterium]
MIQHSKNSASADRRCAVVCRQR